MKLAALALVAVSTPAIAGVEVAVDPAAPFSATELADAVRLRWRGDGDVTVQVAKRGDDEIVIHVGQRSQKVRVANDDRAASTRVVAIVILSMLDEPPSATPQLDDELPPVFEPAPPAPTTPAKRPWGVQLGGRLAESDDGFKSLLVTGGVAIPLAPHVRASGMIGLGHSTYRNNTTMLPMRVGRPRPARRPSSSEDRSPRLASHRAAAAAGVRRAGCTAPPRPFSRSATASG